MSGADRTVIRIEISLSSDLFAEYADEMAAEFVEEKLAGYDGPGAGDKVRRELMEGWAEELEATAISGMSFDRFNAEVKVVWDA